MKKKYAVLVLIIMIFCGGMILLGWVAVKDKPKRIQYSDWNSLLFNHGLLVIKEFVGEIDATTQQSRRFREILKEEFDSYEARRKTDSYDSRGIYLLERQIAEIKDRAWYENKPPEVEQLEKELRVMEFGDKASPPIRVAYERIKELLTDEQKQKFDATEKRISDEMARALYQMDVSPRNSKELENFVDKSEMKEETKQLLKEMMKPHVYSSRFRVKLPMAILIDEDLPSLNLTPNQKTKLQGISRSYRENFDAELDRYYDQVAGQLAHLKTLCDSECDALQEGDADSGQHLGNEIDEILNTDPLLLVFSATLDKVGAVLDDHQKQAFVPIRENALSRFADYLGRSMTCENMHIVYEPCELPVPETQPGVSSSQPGVVEP